MTKTWGTNTSLSRLENGLLYYCDPGIVDSISCEQISDEYLHLSGYTNSWNKKRKGEGKQNPTAFNLDTPIAKLWNAVLTTPSVQTSKSSK